MLDLIADNLALIMFVAMFFLIFCGFPVAYVMGGMGIVFGYIGYLLGVFPFTSLSNVILRMWGGVLPSIPFWSRSRCSFSWDPSLNDPAPRRTCCRRPRSC